MNVRVAGFALLVLALSMASTAGAADEGAIDLRLHHDFAFANATVLVGDLDVEGVANATGATGVDELSVPSGTLYVCPADRGAREGLPSLAALGQRCRNEDQYENPDLEVTGRTWIQAIGNVSVEMPKASTSIAWHPGNQTQGPDLASSTSQDPVEWRMEDDAFAFRPIVASSQIRVQTPESDESYNGTDWIFYFEGSGAVSVESEGSWARYRQPVQVTLQAAGAGPTQQSLDPKILLDLQDAIEGPDAREPVRNATRLFADYGRIPQLVDGAVLGYLDGFLAGRTLDRGGVTLVHVEELGAEIGERVNGNASVAFVRSSSGFSPGLSSPAGLPVFLPALLVLAAGVAVVLRDRPVFRSRDRWIEAGTLGVAALVWDWGFFRVTGTSAIALIGESPDLGVYLAVLGFELVAFVLASLILYLPARIALERGLPERFEVWARPLAGLVLAVYALVRPGSIIVLGQLLAQL